MAAEVISGLIVFAVLMGGFALGWVARSWVFWAEEDCADPHHKTE